MRESPSHPDPDLVRSLAGRLPLRRGEELDELVHEVWLRLRRHDESLQRSPAWIASVARNVVREGRRRGSARRVIEERYAAERDAAVITREAERQDGLEAVVDEVFHGLPEVDRALLRRRVLDRASLEELADEFDMAPRAVKRRLREAKERLRTRRAVRGGWAALFPLPWAWRPGRRAKVAVPSVAAGVIAAALVTAQVDEPPARAGEPLRPTERSSVEGGDALASVERTESRLVPDVQLDDTAPAAAAARALEIRLVNRTGESIPDATLGVFTLPERTKLIWWGPTRPEGEPAVIPADKVERIRAALEAGRCWVGPSGPNGDVGAREIVAEDLEAGQLTVEVPERLGPLHLDFELMTGEPVDVPMLVDVWLADDWGTGRYFHRVRVHDGEPVTIPFTDLDSELEVLCRPDLGWGDERIRVARAETSPGGGPREGRRLKIVLDEPEALIRGVMRTTDGEPVPARERYDVTVASRSEIAYSGNARHGGVVEFSVPYEMAQAGEVVDLVVNAGPAARAELSLFMPEPRQWHEFGSLSLAPIEPALSGTERSAQRRATSAPVERIRGLVRVPDERDPYRLALSFEASGDSEAKAAARVLVDGRFVAAIAARGPLTLVVRTRSDDPRELYRIPIAARPSPDAELLVDLSEELPSLTWEEAGSPAMTPPLMLKGARTVEPLRR